MAHMIIGTLSTTLQPGATLSYESDGTITGIRPLLRPARRVPFCHRHSASGRLKGLLRLLYARIRRMLSLHQRVYRGVWSGSATRVDVQASLSANPIETHPNFVSALGGTPGAPLNGAVFDTNGTFLGWPAGATHGLGGVRYYLAAGCSIRFTTSTTSGSDVASALAAIGSISSSISGGGSTFTTAYSYPGFMLQNVTVDWQYLGSAVTIYTYSVVWVMTQPPGWNSNIYPP